jgi:PKD repeat protein
VFTAGPSVAPQAQSATVSWTTNETTTGVVRFGLTAALGDSVTSAANTTHADVLSGLTRGTGYFYQVVARDLASNATSSGITSFTTLANGVPVANATGSPASGPAPLTVQFSSTGSSDPDGDALTFGWTFGDGGSSAAAAPSHPYAAAGTYNAILTVNDGHGGIGLDTVVVVVTPAGTSFPTTPVVDSFNRANGAPGASWAGDVTRCAISGNALALTQPDASIVYAAASYGATQEAYVTLTSVTGISERDLMLKVQGLTWSAGHIEVRYSAGSVSVSTYAPTGGWVTRGVFPVTMAAGDKLGARADAAGQVQVYRNGTLLGTTSVGTWPFAGSGGRIGLTLSGGTAATLDDFGGGTVPGTAPAAPAMARVADGMELEGIPHDMAWLSPPRPNPSGGPVRFTLSLPVPMAVAFRILDLQGREIWSESHAADGGLTTLSWNGTASGRRAPAGMYLAIVDLDGRRLTRRFMRVE